jgi:iron complex outermembrane receptor protein
MDPDHQTDLLFSAFIQDEIELLDTLHLTLGSKIEHNDYTGIEVQPSARIAWTPNDRHTLWAAISRAVRTPSRIDRDLYAPASPPFVIAGGSGFESEKLTAYEIGYRAQPSPMTSLSISAFYNVYDELRSVEPSDGALILGNMMQGKTSGVEIWGNHDISDRWQLKFGYGYLWKDLRLRPGSGDTFGVQAAGNDPRHQFSVRSIMTFGDNVDFDLALRAIDRLPNPEVPGYVALDARIGWRFSRVAEVSLSGFSLVRQRHPEFGTAPGRSDIGRTILVKVLWNF